MNRINYPILQPLDFVFTTSTYSPISALIKLKKGLKYIFNPSISSHAAVIISIQGQLIVAEMLGERNGLTLSSIEKYNNSSSGNHITSVFRPNLPLNIIEGIQDQIILDFRHCLEYDFKGLVEHVIRSVKDDRKKMYCSEYLFELTRNHIPYPEGFREKVRPDELEEFAKNSGGCFRRVKPVYLY